MIGPAPLGVQVTALLRQDLKFVPVTVFPAERAHSEAAKGEELSF